MPKVVRVTKTEFELDNGTICPIPFELEETPVLEEFQATYDSWLQVFHDKGILKNEQQQENGQHRQSSRHAGSMP